MQYIVGALIVILGFTGWKAYDYKKQYDICKELPSLKTSFEHIAKYVGAKRDFRFKLVCRGEISNFEKDCFEHKVEDVTDQQVVLKPYKEGKVFKSSYALDWIETANYYVDFSESSNWDINSDGSNVSVTLPAVEIERILDNRKLLPYVIDKKLFKNDTDYLIDIIAKSHEFSLPKHKNYLITYRKTIEEEVAKSVKKLISNVAQKLKYPTNLVVEVIIDGRKY